MTDSLVKLLSTFFYIGRFPWAPGTAGSAAGLLIFLGTAHAPSLRAALFCAIAVCGFLVSGRAEKIFKKKDPKEVVIDEVAGIFLVFFALPVSVKTILVGFLVYRILDVVKPPPARRLEKMGGGFGIMADDILCALYAHLALRFSIVSGVLR